MTFNLVVTNPLDNGLERPVSLLVINVQGVTDLANLAQELTQASAQV